MRREDLPANPSATFVLPTSKTVYVSVPKAACTSTKWLLADLQGEDPERFHRAVSSEVSRTMTIHHRRLWQNTPTLHQLSDAELEEVSPDNGWFVFGVVRHPANRLWSGWQSKYLLQDPHFKLLAHDAPRPRVPSCTSDVVEDFGDFVRHLGDNPKGPAAHDRHFRPQHRLLRTSTMSYTRIYRTDEIPEMLMHLEAHLRPLGVDSMPGLMRSNEAPLPPIPSVFSDEVLDVVSRLYARDLETFGWSSALPTKLATSSEYSEDQLAEVQRLVDRTQRIGDLYDAAKRSSDQLVELRREHRRAQRQLRQLRSRPAPPSPRGVRALSFLRRRVRRVVERVLSRAS